MNLKLFFGKKFSLLPPFSIMSEDLMKSIIVLIQNDKGDKEILMRILNDLKKDKKPFGPDKPYLRTIIEEYLPEDIHLLKTLE